jgi:protein arginine kinase activator
MGLCERCKKAQATFHMTNIEPGGGPLSEKHMCEKCAIEEGLVQVQKPVVPTELLEQFVQGSKASAALSSMVCGHCGLSYLEFRNQGLLGCPHDYDEFKEVLAPLIERVHEGADHHTGKSPQHGPHKHTTQQDLRKLRKQLDEAIKAEDYERAAGLRDRLRELEKK